MGLYYSYFKSMVDAPTWWEGFDELIHDTRSEHPKTINVLKRFNLYPEFVVGSCKRVFDHVTKLFKIRTKDCWQINRGEGKKPVQSCEGIGDDHYFYIFPVWWLSGLLMSGIFLYGSTVSESLWGGIIAVACYFFNHGEATRVMWTPPLRESWSFPFLILQVTHFSPFHISFHVSSHFSRFLYYIALPGDTSAQDQRAKPIAASSARVYDVLVHDHLAVRAVCPVNANGVGHGMLSAPIYRISQAPANRRGSGHLTRHQLCPPVWQRNAPHIFLCLVLNHGTYQIIVIFNLIKFAFYAIFTAVLRFFRFSS